MPSTKDFDKKNHKKASSDISSDKKITSDQSPKRAQRRPGRDPERVVVESLDEVKVIDVETGETMNENNSNKSHSEDIGAQAETKSSENIEIKFPGSEILRAKFSKPFEVAESIATEWMNDGKFEGLPLGHPLAQYFAAKGLQKAKQVEKKVLESPVTEKVAMQALQAGMKAQEIISQVRAKVKKN